MSTESLESSEIIDIIDIINQKPLRKERDPHKTKADKPFRLLRLNTQQEVFAEDLGKMAKKMDFVDP